MAYTYKIDEDDVTDSQYVTFLNDVDPTGGNALGLYSPYPGGDSGYGVIFNAGGDSGSKYSVMSGYANMPIVDVDYWDTLRFVNWMNNGEGDASTETGAYTLLGDTPTPSNASILLANPQHNAGATVWLPTENEWYKAAYYDPADASYSMFATQSDTVPGNVVGNGANEANFYTGNGYSVTQSSSYSSSQNYLTAVGSFTGSPSYYGTYDQSGDVWNWNSTVVSSEYPVMRGGGWDFDSASESSSVEGYDSATFISYDVGFRVASEAVPEPSTWAMMTAGVGLMFGFRRCRS